jgi:serine-type D-Ala-D-Ala carboxypeptidase/endopeptidase (penicillin-binding protein 4)
VPGTSRHPLAALTVIAAVPALLFASLAVYADGRAEVDVLAEPAPVVAPGVAPRTPLLSVRRTPQVLASDHRREVLADAVQSLSVEVDSGSCLAVGVNGRLLTGANTAASVIPASNLKVVVAAVALEVLGPGTVFDTTVMGASPVGGVVQGDVYLVGGGDPVLSEGWYTQITASHKRPPLNATGVEALADALVTAGVQRITGSVLGVDDRYDDERHPPGWSDDIRASIDGVPVGALVINDSVSQTGAISDDPARHAASVLTRLLRDRGVVVEGDADTGSLAAGTVQLATVTSQALPALLNEMLATSDNLTAEMLVKEIGAKAGGAGTREAGLKVISDTLAKWGTPLEGVELHDGSGLSRENRITCTTLLAVLQRGSATDPVGAGLARAGQDGSTLDGKFEEPGLAGVLQAKTGSLREVKALCGYFPAGGDEIAFVLVLNGPTATAFDTRWDLLGTALLAAAASPGADVLTPLRS